MPVMTAPIVPESEQFETAASAPGWVEVVSHLDPRYGGLSAAVPALTSAVTMATRARITVAGFCRASERFAPAVEDGVSLSYWPESYAGWLRDRGARRSFRELISASQGVHIHGLWQLSTGAAARAARATGKPYVVSAHGMLERWALANKKFKKAIYASLCERAYLAGARCLHALTEAEAEDYRRFGLRNPIAIIPNGVVVPQAASSEIFFEHFPALAGRRLVLFLGRLHPKKGLDILAEAWTRVCSRWPDAHLVLAGPDSEGTQAAIERRLVESGATDRATFTGMLAGDVKWSALAAAQAFVLPSYSEGLSVSVLEAMGLGKPVIITHPCNLPEVARYGCGWTIAPEAEALTNVLDEMLGASALRLDSLGDHGARLVRECYSWPAIGEAMAELYAWMAGGPYPRRCTLLPAEGEKR